MKKSEAVIVMAYTDINMGCMDEYYDYIEKLLGQSVSTDEIPALRNKTF